MGVFDCSLVERQEFCYNGYYPWTSRNNIQADDVLKQSKVKIKCFVCNNRTSVGLLSNYDLER